MTRKDNRPARRTGLVLYSIILYMTCIGYAVPGRAQAVFVSEDFSSGSYSSLPAGWSAGGSSGTGAADSTWQWVAAGYCDSNKITPLFSTTASNGQMLYNSLAIYSACYCATQGWLQSPSYNCSGHSTVSLNFQNFYTAQQDSCDVWVGTDSSFSPGTYTIFPVPLNSSLCLTNVFNGQWLPGLSDNPSVVHINITTAAANQPKIYIRFVYQASFGGLQWLIDDMSLSETPAIGVQQTGASMIYYGGNPNDIGIIMNLQSFGSIPISLVSQLYPFTSVNNYGQADIGQDSITATIYKGGAQLYQLAMPLPLQVNTYVPSDFTAYNGLVPADTGLYKVVFDCGAGAELSSDSAFFSITDTVYSMCPVVPQAMQIGNVSHIDTLNPANNVFESIGTHFYIPFGYSPTLSSVSVQFDSATVPGDTVGVHLYSNLFYTPAYAGTTVFRPITAADIASGYAVFMVDEAASGGPIVMSGNVVSTSYTGDPEGSAYAAIVTCRGCTGNVSIPESNNVSQYLGSSGLIAPAQNDGDSTFSFQNNFARQTFTPAITLNIKPYNTLVTDPAMIHLDGVYPNPASTIVNIPFALPVDGYANISITDITGKQVDKIRMNCAAHLSVNARIDCLSYAAGIYIYSISCAGVATASGQFAVYH